MDANKAKETVDRVTKDLDAANDDNAQLKALENLQSDLKSQMEPMSAEDRKAFMGQVMQSLTDRKLLPVLALAYAKQADDELDESDLKADKKLANRELREGNQARQLELAMLKYLTDNYSTVIMAEDESGYDSTITAVDVSAKLKEFRDTRDQDHRVEKNHLAATDSARILLNGGDKSLFNFIDRNNNDGYVTKAELEKYLADHKASGITCNDDSSQFSSKKVDFVTRLLASWDDRDGTKWLRGGYKSDGAAEQYLTKTGLLESAGKTKVEDLGAPVEKKTVKVDETTEARYAEGYWQIAERLLKAKGKYTNDDVAREYSRLKELNGNKELKTGVSVKTGQIEVDMSKNKGMQGEASVEVQKGDSYWSIARHLAGKGASSETLRNLVAELQKKNNNQALVWNPKSPMKIKI